MSWTDALLVSTTSGTVPESGEPLRLPEHLGQHRQLVAAVAGGSRGGVHVVDGAGLVGGQVGAFEQGPETEPRQGRHGRRRRDASWRRCADSWGSRELVGAGAVEQHHPGHLVGVLVGVGQGVRAADGVPDQDEGAGLAGGLQQGVEVLGGRDGILRLGEVVAPPLAGTVVGADAGGWRCAVDDAGPRGRELARGR